MTWIVIPDSDIDPDSPITTGLMTAIRNNVAAAFAKDSGAPVLTNDYIVNAMIATNAVNADSIAAGAVGTSEIAAGGVGQSEIAAGGVGQSEIAANSVGQSEIKTTYQEVSQSVPSSDTIKTYFTFAGGVYALGHTFRANTVGGSRTQHLVRENEVISTSNVARWLFTTAEGSAATFTSYVRLYYINSSPPHDLGFGNIPLFIFLIMDTATKEIESMSVSTEAPWHYNGPTDITPSYYTKDGTPYKQMKEVEYDLLTQGKDIRSELRGANKTAVADRLKDDIMVSVEIGQAMKNADMSLIPHPFRNNDLTGKTIAVINPQSDICETLLLLHERGDSISELFYNGDIVIEDSPLIRGFDSSIKCFNISYKS